MIVTAQHLRADHDVNGNPRRLYLVTAIDPASGATCSAAVDEGYAGSKVLGSLIGIAHPTYLPTLDITVKEYNHVLDLFADEDVVAEFREFIGEDDEDEDF